MVASHVERALRSEQIAINTVLITELAHFLVKNLGPVDGEEKLAIFLGFPLVISDFDYKTVLESLDMLKRYSHLGVGGRDATVLAMMRKSRTKKIMTHDEALKRVDWLEAIDPISAK